GSVDSPVREILRTAIRDDQIAPPNDAVDVRVDVEVAGGGSFFAQRAGEDGKIGLRALREQSVRSEFLDQCNTVGFTGRGIERANARKRIESDLVRIVSEGVGVEVTEIGFGM